jgi:propanediol dehydratase small subunit
MRVDWLLSSFAIVGTAVGVAVEIARRKRLRPYFQRRCAGRHWRKQFPTSSKAQIREFLGVFIDAFALPRKHQLKFRPDDRVMDVYRAINQRGWPDAMELESLAHSLKRRFGVSLEGIWRDDLTLGEVFALI